MKSFEELGLDSHIIDSVKQLGFQTPTPIQEKAIPILLQRTKDFMGLAQTGTGKTAAFGLPLLQVADTSKKQANALIICPTRELCIQIANDITSFATNAPRFSIIPVYGGASIGQQIRDLKRGVTVIVATPGRLIDLIERKSVQLEHIEIVVFDEADEMLNMGFKDDIEFILNNTPNRQSTWLFSATMPSAIRQVSKKYMQSPVEISIGTVNSGNENIDHQYYTTIHSSRYETLKRIIDFSPGMYSIVFTRTKRDAQEITENLIREGYDIEALHGDLNQQQRDKVMGRFREKSIQILIATDVAARGIDVQAITHVINYELPDDTEVYTHRSGRTGRAGRSGVSVSIVTPKEMYRLKQIEKLVKTKFHKMDIPSGKDVCRKQFFHYIDKMFEADISHGSYETYLPALRDKFASMEKEEILQRMAALEFERFLKYYENAIDLNIRTEVRTPSRLDRGSSASSRGSTGRVAKQANFEGNYQRLFVNLGTKDGFYKASFLQFILDMSDQSKDVIGKIDMKMLNSWVEVDTSAAKKMIDAIDGKNYKGRKIRMNPA